MHFGRKKTASCRGQCTAVWEFLGSVKRIMDRPLAVSKVPLFASFVTPLNQGCSAISARIDVF